MNLPTMRLPLQVGTSSLYGIYRSSVTGTPGIFLLLLTARAWAVSSACGVMSFTGGALLVAYSVKQLIRAVRERPSDLVFSRDRVMIDGGLYNGAEIRVSDAPGSFKLEEFSETRLTFRGIAGVSLIMIPVVFISPFVIIIVLIEIFGVAGGIIILMALLFAAALAAGSYLTAQIISRLRNIGKKEKSGTPAGVIKRVWTRLAGFIHLLQNIVIYRMVMTGNDGKKAVAEADQAGEQHSLKLLFLTLENYGSDDPKETAADLKSTTLNCGGCGNPIAPADLEYIVCHYCNDKTLMPAELREKVRAASTVSDLRALSASLLKRLMNQPDARYSAQTLIKGGAILVAVWPVAAIIILLINYRNPLDFNTGWAIGTGMTAMITSVFFLVRARFSDRQALRIMTLGFGAIPPEKKGWPYTCHSCGAPLPVVADALTVSCVFCDADNIIGLDFRRKIRKESDQLFSLQSSMKNRISEERFRILYMALFPVLLGISIISLLPAFGALKAPLIDAAVFDSFFGTRAPVAVLSGLPGPRRLMLNTDYTEVAMSLFVINEGTITDSYRDGSIYQIRLYGGEGTSRFVAGQNRPSGIAIGRDSKFDNGVAYWITRNDIMKKPLTGGDIKPVAVNQTGPTLIAAYMNHIYFYNSGTHELMETGNNGGIPVSISRIDGDVTSLLAADSGYGIYWISIADGNRITGRGTLYSLSGHGKNPVILSDDVYAFAGLCYLKYPEPKLYWVQMNYRNRNSILREWLLTGDFRGNRAVAEIPAGINSLTVSSGGEMIHWIEGNAPHARIVRQYNGVREVLESDVNTGSIAFTNRSVYWTETGEGRVMKRLEHPWESR